MKVTLAILAFVCASCTFVIVVGPNENDVDVTDELPDVFLPEEDAGTCHPDAGADAGCADAGDSTE